MCDYADKLQTCMRNVFEMKKDNTRSKVYCHELNSENVWKKLLYERERFQIIKLEKY